MSGEKIFALDLGVNSIGWAVVNRTDQEKGLAQYEICGLNSRIFQEMVDAKEKPKNQKRRQQRGMRRNYAQRKRRRAELIHCLQENNLLPPIFDERQANKIDKAFAECVLRKSWNKEWQEKEKFHASPFAMRALGLERDLQAYEFGRALLHLQKRRGYFSNRGAKYIELFEYLKALDEEGYKELEKQGSDKDTDKETGIVLGKIRKRLSDMKEQGSDKDTDKEPRIVLGKIRKLLSDMKEQSSDKDTDKEPRIVLDGIGKLLSDMKEQGSDKDTDKEPRIVLDGIRKLLSDMKKQGSDKETRIVLSGIDKLSSDMIEQGARTIGEYVWKKSHNTGQSPQRITRYYVEETKQRGGDEKIGFYATRKMTVEEFNLLWQRQAQPLELSEELRKRIECLIFYQTPLEKSFQAKTGKVVDYLGLEKYIKRRNKPTRGACSFIIDKPRMAKAALPFQEARTRQFINNVTLSGNPLNKIQRETLYDALKDQDNLNEGRMPWKKVAELFGCKRAEINYSRAGDSEEDGKSGVIGNRTAHDIISSVGIDFWKNLPERQEAKGLNAKKREHSREQLVDDLLTIVDRKALYRRLVNHWGLPGGFGNAAFKLATLELESGYSKHCRRVWNDLLPHLREGKNYYESCQRAGFWQENEKTGNKKKNSIAVEDIPNIANPIVQKALYEARKVVNALVQRYGHPVEIRVEMAREMAQSKKHRKEIEQQQMENRKRNAAADNKLMEYIRSGKVMGLEYMSMGGGKKSIKPKDRKKYIMWHDEQEMQCPYCGKRIGCADLFNGGAEVEHILPQVAFQQNYMNTVLACKKCNTDKNGRSPYEAWGNSDKWQDICSRIGNKKKDKNKFPNMPLVKKRRICDEKFSSRDSRNDFVQRQLKDTQYIAVAVKNMLEKIDIPVRISKGRATALLRRLWGLNNVLPNHPDAGRLRSQQDDNTVLLYDENAAKESKNRMDHRHHAVDALVIAMTDTATLQKMTQRWERFMERRNFGDKPFPLPISQYANDSGALCSALRERFSRTVVSHMTKRKVYGALHEETAYGESSYEEEVPLSSRADSRKKFITELLAITVNSNKQAIGVDGKVVQGDAKWLVDEDMRNILTRYLKEGNHKNYPFHPQTCEPIKSVRVFRRCYVHRISVEEALKYAKKEWKPGNNTWIMDKTVHAVLQSCLNKQSVKEAAKRLIQQPPRMPLRGKAGEGPVIKTVRVAGNNDEASVRRLQKYKIYKTGSNHHAEIFYNEKDETRGRIVSMLDAAKRSAQGKAVIDKNPEEEWGGEWKFKMYLCINDMVEFDAIDEGEKLPRKNLQNKEFPEERLVYRVQKMSGSRVFFRHHTLATSSDSDNYGYICRSLSRLKGCRKAQLGLLGHYSND